MVVLAMYADPCQLSNGPQIGSTPSFVEKLLPVFVFVVAIMFMIRSVIILIPAVSDGR